MNTDEMKAAADGLAKMRTRAAELETQISTLKAERDALLAVDKLTVGQDRALSAEITALALEAHVIRDALAGV